METLEINVKAKGPEHEYIICKQGSWYDVFSDGKLIGLALFCRTTVNLFDFIGEDGNRWFEGSFSVMQHGLDWNTYKLIFLNKQDQRKWKMVPVNVKIVRDA